MGRGVEVEVVVEEGQEGEGGLEGGGKPAPGKRAGDDGKGMSEGGKFGSETSLWL